MIKQCPECGLMALKHYDDGNVEYDKCRSCGYKGVEVTK